ncbi:MAG: peptidase T [Lachnospiraceae bacterium]|nr:peptidase T [Lachnospiraceae bacterium]
MTDVIARFLEYVRLDTQSDEHTGTQPSTAKQHDLAKLLYDQLCAMGIEKVTYDKEHCYVYASIPASAGMEGKGKKLGFIAHMDTAMEVTGANVKPRIVSYGGGDIVLNEKENILFSPEEFPELTQYIGKDLIVTDGTTLLGADDKAGVAEIMAMAAFFTAHPEMPHGELRIAFTPDEEIGSGTDYFDIELFDADVAYTVDGGALGELEYENFNAASAEVKVSGRSVHPGDAKDKMINASLVAMDYHALLPAEETPAHTEGYEGFYHLTGMSGAIEQAELSYLIRDHDKVRFEQRKECMQKAAEQINERFGQELVRITIEDSYYNMCEKIKPHMELIEYAKAAMEELGIPAKTVPIRGGTDGARLSFMGLPCPNLCTGGRNCHSRFEYACVQDMEQIVKVLVGIAKRFSE